MLSGAEALVAVLVGGGRRQHHQIGRRQRPRLVRVGRVGVHDRALLIERHIAAAAHADHEHRIACIAVLPTTWPLTLSDSTTDWPVAVSVRPEAPPGVESA